MIPNSFINIDIPQIPKDSLTSMAVSRNIAASKRSNIILQK